MPEIARHVSPDGVLQLVVVKDHNGDWIVGLDGFHWHTHGDLLVGEYRGAQESAVESFIDDVKSSRFPIAVRRIDGCIREAWIDRSRR